MRDDSDKSQKQVLQNSLIYGLASVCSGGITFFLLPVYTRLLSVSDYGTFGYVNSITAVFGVFLLLSLDSAIVRYYFSVSEIERPRYLGTLLTIIIAMSLLLFVVVFFSPTLGAAIFTGVTFFPFVPLAAATAVAKAPFIMYQTILQTRQQAGRYAMNSILFIVISISFGVGFLFMFRSDAVGLLTGVLVGTVIMGVYSVLAMITGGEVVLSADTGHLRAALLYSSPLLLYEFAYSASPVVVKSLIVERLSLEAVGMLDVGIQFGAIVGVAQLAINRSYAPWAFKCISSGELESLKALSIRISKYIFVLCFGLSLFSREAVELMLGPTYEQAWITIPPLAMAALLRGLYYFYANSIAYKATGNFYITGIALASNSVYVFLSYIMVNHLGIVAAPCAQLAAGGLTLISAVIINNQITEVRFPIMRLAFSAFLLATVALGILLAEYRLIEVGVNRVGLIVVKAVILTGYALYIVFSQFRRPFALGVRKFGL